MRRDSAKQWNPQTTHTRYAVYIELSKCGAEGAGINQGEHFI